MKDLPRVTYSNSMKQEIMDDWGAFLNKHVLPIDVVCEQCHGVVHVERLAHVEFNKGHSVEVAGAPIPLSAADEAITQLIDSLGEAVDGYLVERGEAEQRRRFGHMVMDGRQWMLSHRVPSKYELKQRMITSLGVAQHGGSLQTKCKNCNKWIEIELPGFIRDDLRDALMHRIAVARDKSAGSRYESSSLDSMYSGKAQVQEPQSLDDVAKSEAASNDALLSTPAMMIGGMVLLMIVVVMLKAGGAL